MRVRRAGPDDFAVVTAMLEELGRATVTDATRDACRAIYERHMGDDEPTTWWPRSSTAGPSASARSTFATG
jgi:hypothetical protein